MISSGRLASFGGSSLVALMVRKSVPQSLSASKLAYEENLAELEKEATKNSFKRQSLILPSLFFSILCFASVCLTWCSQSFQLQSLQQKELASASTAETSLQQKELVAAYATDLSFQLQSLQQKELASASIAEVSLQQKELAAAASTAETSLQQTGAACLVGLGAVSTVMASCEIPLASGECLQGTYDSMPQSLLQHRARETAAGKLKVGGAKRRNESIHHVPVPQTWQNYVALDTQNLYMDLTNVVQNNLGGKGPNTSAAAAEEIRYQNIFPTLTTGSVDLVVTALTLYQPKKPGNNGNIGDVGSINFRGGKSTTFLFKFVDTFNHSKNVTLEKLFFSYYDIDNDRKALRHHQLQKCSAI